MKSFIIFILASLLVVSFGGNIYTSAPPPETCPPPQTCPPQTTVAPSETSTMPPQSTAPPSETCPPPQTCPPQTTAAPGKCSPGFTGVMCVTECGTKLLFCPDGTTQDTAAGTVCLTGPNGNVEQVLPSDCPAPSTAPSSGSPPPTSSPTGTSAPGTCPPGFQGVMCKQECGTVLLFCPQGIEQSTPAGTVCRTDPNGAAEPVFPSQCTTSSTAPPSETSTMPPQSTAPPSETCPPPQTCPPQTTTAPSSSAPFSSSAPSTETQKHYTTEAKPTTTPPCPCPTTTETPPCPTTTNKLTRRKWWPHH